MSIAFESEVFLLPPLNEVEKGFIAHGRGDVGLLHLKDLPQFVLNLRLVFGRDGVANAAFEVYDTELVVGLGKYRRMAVSMPVRASDITRSTCRTPRSLSSSSTDCQHDAPSVG